VPRFFVSLDSFIIDADSVLEADDGRLIFYIDGWAIAELPAEAWLEYNWNEEEEKD